MSWTVPIRPAVLPSWRALQDALDKVGPVACRGADADLWTSERADERESASYRCAGCPVIVQCHTYATAARERFGVWAGVDRTLTTIHQRKETTDAKAKCPETPETKGETGQRRTVEGPRGDT